MRLKSLDIIGFKSFYERTSVHFHENVNAVVGPNGCGKSNILDAIRWVLGEQNPRRLRAEDMGDVISNGGESLKPLGMAEVCLNVSELGKNGFDEVAIKRRLFRSGESEYYLNGVPCRLKDITETFLGTGAGARAHSIIAQGRVEHIITAKPDEKRVLIEEVAGIVKYKVRRRETESRIESTKENLKRLKDVTNEVSRQMQTLSRQAKDAERFKRLSEEMKKLEGILLFSKLKDLQDEMEKLLAEKSEIESSRSILGTEVKNKEAFIRNVELSLLATEAQIEDLEQEIYKIKLEVQAKESLKEILRNEASGIDEFIEKLDREIELLREEEKKVDSHIGSKKMSLNEVSLGLSENAAGLLEKEETISSLRSMIVESRSRLESTRKTLFETLDRHSSLRGSILGYEKELGELEWRRDRTRKEIEEVHAEKQKAASGMIEFRRSIEEIEGRKNEILNGKMRAEAALSSLTVEHESTKEDRKLLLGRLSEAESRLSALSQIQSNYEWLPEGIRGFLIERKGEGILGVIADFISVPEGYERAIEAVLGDKLKWAVVKDSGDAIQAVESLRELSIGRGTFIPVNGREKNGRIEKNGSEAVALSDIVKVERIDRGVIEGMLNGVFVVSSLRQAIRLRDEIDEGASFVTVNGDFLDSTGAISGGLVKEGVFERKREIEELSAETARLEEETSGLSRDIEIKERELERVSILLDELEQSLKEVEIKEAEARKDIVNVEENLSRTERRHEIVRFELDQTDVEIEEKQTQLRESRALFELVQNEKTDFEEAFRVTEEEVKRLQKDEKSLEDEISNARIEAAALREKVMAIQEDLSDLESRKTFIAEKIKLEAQEIEKKREGKLTIIKNDKDAEAEIENLHDILQVKEEELSLRKNEKIEISTRLKIAEEEKENIRTRVSTIQERFITLGLELNRLESEIRHTTDYIQKSGFDAKLVSCGDLGQGHMESFDRETAESRLREIKEKIEKCGPVNLLAPQEYTELEERSKFLDEQSQDLLNAISSLRKAINRIDRESEMRFKETFEIVNKKFGEIFSKLFRGGEAKLVLTNPEDLLQTGVEVMVRPKGKRLQPINLLSGGEKALSAIALVLSACFIKSTPFLLFDEIDAPLDDVNTAQFTDLIREIAKESQVVIITHNKKTMQAVNSLIGITSDKPGVSKVVSVEMRES